ncbi:MAG: choline/carnitine O-acyltransferase [Candidatus Zhuqueibacterota bacterium]
MDSDRRSTDVYEQIDGYTKPPIVPLPATDDIDSLKYLGLTINDTSRRIVNAVKVLTGFRSFETNLPNTIEHHLRKNNMRLPGLFAPAISATLVLADDARIANPLERAATLIFSVRNLCDDIFSGKFSQDQFRDQGLEMGQYPNLFSTSVVVSGKDVQVYKSTQKNTIAVIVAGKFYGLNLGNLTSIGQVSKTLSEIVQSAHANKARADYVSPGPLTAATNITQQNIFGRLSRNEVNAASLAMLRNSLFTLCLEIESTPSTYSDVAIRAQSNNYQNRWFHSALQIVVFGNAKAAAICNFTVYVDGNTMMRSAAEIQKRAAQVSLHSTIETSEPSPISVKQMDWQVNREAVRRAYRDIRMILDNQQATFEIPNIGRKYFDEHQTDAVPAFILALQLAMHRMTGKWVKIEQFLAMSKYRCMDLTTTTVTTPEVVQFGELMENGRMDVQESLSALNAAIVSQNDQARAARSQLRLGIIFTLYQRSLSASKKAYVRIIVLVAAVLLRILGLIKMPPGNDVIVSHPEIYPEIPVVGRPGIRLPYVKYLGLHYQIFDEKTIITLMPGVSWHIPNTEFIYTLRKSLESVQWVLRHKE